MSGRGEVVLTGAVVTAALAVALANVVPLVTREKPVEKVDGWERALEVGHSVAGPRNAPVKLVVLSDLECPVCRAFHSTATELVEVRDDVELVYVPFPLSYHEHAIPAANAAECAQEVTRLSEWIDVTYASQDSLGHLGWGTLAERAAIRDTVAIAECANAGSPAAQVSAGLELAKDIGAHGTPTVLVNQWKLAATPDAEVLASIRADVAQGRRPKVK